MNPLANFDLKKNYITIEKAQPQQQSNGQLFTMNSAIFKCPIHFIGTVDECSLMFAGYLKNTINSMELNKAKRLTIAIRWE